MAHTLLLPQLNAEHLPRGLLITTKYAGPTDSKGSRIVATCKRDNETTFRATVSYDDTHGQLDAHYKGALAVLRKIEEQNEYYAFTIQAVGNCADGYAFVTLANPRP
jgi:hypothetical protein